jgi:hypothetical protein
MDPDERVRTLVSSKRESHREVAPHVVAPRLDLTEGVAYTSAAEAKRAKRDLINELLAQGHWVNGRGTPFHVYVIELADGVGTKTGRRDRPWLYVGETSKDPQDRINQHRDGAMRGRRRIYNKDANRHFVRARKDLYEDLPTVFTREKSRQLEEETALRLKSEGYSVIWG